MTEEAEQNSNGVSMQNMGKSPPTYQLGWTVDPSFSGKVSISVADAGETAIVVSMVDGQPKSDPCNSFPSAVLDDLEAGNKPEAEVLDDFVADNRPEASLSDTNSGNAKLDVHVENISCNELMCNSSIYSNEGSNAAPENDKSSEGFLDNSASRVCMPAKVDFSEKSIPFQALKCAAAELTASLPDGFKVSSPPSYDNSETNETSKNKFNVDHKLGLSATTSSAGGTSANCKMDIIYDEQQKNNKTSKFKRKHREEMRPHSLNAASLTSQTTKREVESVRPAKKAKSDGKSLISPSRNRANASVSDKSKNSTIIALDDDDDDADLIDGLVEETDIMSIVQEAHRSRDGPAGPKATHESIDKKDNATGLRVKKILRRGGEEKESSILIQKLGKEIREAVQNKTHDSIGNPKDFDAKLLTAFRAAIVKPKEELSHKLGPARIAVKRSFLQKGKIRENLTKKIYGTSTGRRKHAWNRDCEIEFWKHRCTRSKPEKVETLHSVLEALKKATNSSSDTYQEPDGDTTNSILSRVYLADTSVFPRKDDIKPLSALAGSSVTVNDGGIAETPMKISRSLEPDKVISSHNTGKRAGTLNFTKEASCGKENLDGMATKSTYISEPRCSKGGVQSPKEPGTNSDNMKSDKRKWALEVLARKNASTSSGANRGIEDDKEVALKRNYPLLARLPTNMRPVPSPGHHKKVSLPVRQMQLYRITEHYLRRTNLPLMRRTADTELAVVDAVNVEKDIFGRSNSKLVYINLCSNALSQSCNKPPSTEVIASSSTTAEVSDLAEDTPSHFTAERLNSVEEALKLAGLLSDSPPSSPCRPTRDASEANDPRESTRESDLENGLDMDSHPELDTNGDFEYDLEDEGYIGGSTLLQQNDNSKMKVVFSSLKREESGSANSHRSGNETTTNNQNASKDSIQYDTENTSNGTKTDILMPKISEDEIYKEPSLAECEELYGPEDLSVKNIPDETAAEINRPMKVEKVKESSVPCDSDYYQSRGRAGISEFEIVCCAENSFTEGRALLNRESCSAENSPATSLMSRNSPKERKVKLTSNKPPDASDSISKKVEAYIKEHIRPLCKSGVITAEQYLWAAKKTTDKVMKYHSKAKSASFLIKEGEKVKKLAMEYVEASQREP